MRLFRRSTRHLRRHAIIQRATRRLMVESLEPRIVFSHDGATDFVFAMPADLEQLVAENMAVAAAATIFPGEQISYDTLTNGLPILNSFSSAPAAIYLDFDGGLYHGSESIPAYDTDGNASAYSLSEQLAIYECWRQVSVYFGMFNVNVTTIDTTKPKAWILPSDAGGSGVSYVNVFPNNRPESKAGESTVISRISVMPHELGHNFGMRHTSRYDSLGVKTAEYSGEFDPLHGPIMGLDYSGVIHKWTWWHNSTSSGATSLQNDMQIVANDLDNFGGDGYRPDDYAGTIATATPLTFFGNVQSRVGIIERLTDLDAFSFTSAGGRYSIVAGRDAPSGVDLKLSIYNAAGELLAVEDGDPRAVPYTMVNDQHITLDLPAGTYYAIVESHGNYGDQGQYIVRVDPLTDGWSAEDIGLVGVPGYSTHDSATDTYTVTGSGSDIWSSADGFQYLYQTLDGDGSITARVASMENTNSSAKAGVMIRESLAANSKNALVELKPGNTTHFQYRTGTGGSSASVNGPSGSTWKWVRLTRVGNVITAYASTNGTSWTTVGSQSISMGSKVLIGLATTSHNNVKLNAATYTNVALTGNLNPGPALNDSPVPASLAVNATNSNSVELSWTGVPVAGDANGDGVVNSLDLNLVKANFGSTGAIGAPGDTNGDGVIDIVDYNTVKNNMNGSSQGFAIERSADGINFTQIGTTAAGVTAYTATGLGDFQRYYFRVRALGSGGTVSEASNTVNAVTKAGAVTGLSTMSVSTSQVVIDWRDASGEANYRVQRSNDGETGWTNRGSLLARNTPSFTDTGSTGTTYYYRVLTLDSGGNTAATSTVIAESTRLSTVTGLAFTNQASNQLAFQWNSVTGATGYRVQRSLDGSTFSTIASNVTTTNYADNSVSPGTTYYYRVVGLKSGLTESSGPSAVISATPPAAGGSAPEELTSPELFTAAPPVGSAPVDTAAPRLDVPVPTGSPSLASTPTEPIVKSLPSASGRRHTQVAFVPLDVQSTALRPSALRRFEVTAQSSIAPSRQRVLLDHVLANWDFERRDRELSHSVLQAIARGKAASAEDALFDGEIG